MLSKLILKSRLLIDIEEVIAPTAAVILHRLPGQSKSQSKCGAFTLAQLRDATGQEPLRVVTLVSHLKFDDRTRKAVCINILIWKLI